MSVAIPNKTVFTHLELRSHPLGVGRHTEAEVKAICDRLFYHLRLVERVRDHLALRGSFLLSRLFSSSFPLLFFLSFADLFLGLKPFVMLDNNRLNCYCVFVDLYLAFEERQFFRRHIAGKWGA